MKYRYIHWHTCWQTYWITYLKADLGAAFEEKSTALKGKLVNLHQILCASLQPSCLLLRYPPKSSGGYCARCRGYYREVQNRTAIIVGLFYDSTMIELVRGRTLPLSKTGLPYGYKMVRLSCKLRWWEQSLWLGLSY